MTVTPSYPGVYIEELPSLVHSVTAAPTSIAVFVGYTNPFYSPTKYGPATQLFSFADYQTNFGGFFSAPWQPDYVGQAVNQFFVNGGQTCYVVAVQAENYYDGPGGALVGAISAASVAVAAAGGAFTFTAKQPVGVSYASTTGMAGIPMKVSLSNLQNSESTPGGATDTADIVVCLRNNGGDAPPGADREARHDVPEVEPGGRRADGCPDRIPGGAKLPTRLRSPARWPPSPATAS